MTVIMVFVAPAVITSCAEALPLARSGAVAAAFSDPPDSRPVPLRRDVSVFADAPLGQGRDGTPGPVAEHLHWLPVTRHQPVGMSDHDRTTSYRTPRCHATSGENQRGVVAEDEQLDQLG
jgi:hypothetical protein